jgi:endonuclease/exonuclease/phosphatase family metal-dependent hydrolase
MTDEREVTFLSYNVGLLRQRVCGFEIFANPPYATARLPFIPAAIRSQKADIVALQECYEVEHFDFLCTELQDIYPYYARVESGGGYKFHNGLMLLSKWPILKYELEAMEKVSMLEAYAATKSALNVWIDIPSMGSVMLMNVHTTAGGESTEPGTECVDLDRADEIRQNIASGIKAAADGAQPIIIGDLNAGPEASKENYQQVLDASYKDIFAEYQSKGSAASGNELQHTWDPKNFLNECGPHSTSPGQRYI